MDINFEQFKKQRTFLKFRKKRKKIEKERRAKILRKDLKKLTAQEIQEIMELDVPQPIEHESSWYSNRGTKTS